MSISSSLQASARAAYRDLLRASSLTFSRDPTVRDAFRVKMRSEIIPNATTTDTKQFEEKVTLAKEIAEVLRKNIVQAERVEPEDGAEERWKLNITEHTELGDNETIKNPPPVQSSRSARKRTPSTSEPVHTENPIHNSNIPRYYSQLKKVAKERKIPELREDDLEESFVRGSGPGGQSINKTENNVQLLHKPTGIRVSCQETRSLNTNRMLARRLILDKLDQIENPGLSKQELQRAKQIERERRRRKKAKKKAKAKAEAVAESAGVD
ncbi:Mitochondrial zinc maintenance protein 1, mitochondrial [Abortiporus biennis]